MKRGVPGYSIRGARNGKYRHGASRTKLYRVWRAMKRRCLNPKDKQFADYGGRGITVCERWAEDFSAFLSDMGLPPPGMSLDRRDNDGPYSPENCRWATPKTQSQNSRKPKVITVDGESRNISEWESFIGVYDGAVRYRVARGMSAEQAITTLLRERTCKCA